MPQQSIHGFKQRVPSGKASPLMEAAIPPPGVVSSLFAKGRVARALPGAELAGPIWTSRMALVTTPARQDFFAIRSPLRPRPKAA